MAGKTVKAVRFDMEGTAGRSSDEGENVLQDRNETSDVTLVIEGRELYANRAVLAHFSPVFHAMFFSASGLKEKLEEKVVLTRKKFQDMVTLFNVLLMPSASAMCQVTVDNIPMLLTLADEYQMDQVKAVCLDYVDGQLFDCFKSFHQLCTNTNKTARAPGPILRALQTDIEETDRPSLRMESSIQEGDEGEIANVLRDPNGTSDVTLVIEGRELYANRSVLAHFSPVFHPMFFSGFKEKSEEKVDLPEKHFQEMVILFNVLLMPSASARCQVSDDTLLLLLALADEYQMDQVKAVCQNYIGGVLFDHFKSFYFFHTDAHNPARWIDKYPMPKGTMRGQKIKRKALIGKLVLYLTACGRYQLPAYRDVRDLLITVTRSRGDLYRSRHYRWLLPSDKQICLPSHETLCDKVFDRVRLYDREDDDRDDDDRDDGDSFGDDSEKDDCEGDAHLRLLRWGRALGLRGQDLHDFMNVHEIYPNNFVQSLHSGRQIDLMF